MGDDQPKNSIEEFERAVKKQRSEKKTRVKRKILLRLYIAGMNARARRAIDSIKKICENELKDICILEIIDIREHPNLAKDEQIIAVPTLIKKVPSPLRKSIGDLTDIEPILLGLDIKTIG